MWDPGRYIDTDYGLDDDESFEPADADAPDPVDISSPHVMTVLGPILPDDLGICLPWEYVAGSAGNDNVGAYARRDPIDLVAGELEAFVTVGGRSIVDASSQDAGRNVDGLRRLAGRAPVHLIAVTGRHTHAAAVQMDNALEPRSIEEELLAEIQGGIGAIGIKPGMITFGTSFGEITDVEAHAVTAAARAAARTGYPLASHATGGTMLHEQLDLVERAGLDPTRVIVGNLDAQVSFAYLVAVAGRGAWLCFSRIGADLRNPDSAHAELVMRLAEAGFAGQVLLSHGLAKPGSFVSQGGEPGWIHLMEHFTLELMAAGAAAGLVRTLVLENPARALAIQPPANARSTTG